jgi:hypothetical protein
VESQLLFTSMDVTIACIYFRRKASSAAAPIKVIWIACGFSGTWAL